MNETNSSELDFTLLSQAEDEFNQKRFNDCQKTLETLKPNISSSNNNNSGNHEKINHNLNIVNFYKSHCKDYKPLLEFLLKDIVKFNSKPIGTTGNDNKNRNISIATYNAAVIYYHLKKPYGALEILQPIAEKIEDYDETISLKIGTLMLSLLLTTNQIKKADVFLKFLKNHLRANLDTISSEENNSLINEKNINKFDCLNRLYRLMALLTNIVNKNPVIVPEDGSPEFSVLKAHQYYVGKDFQMAAKQLSKKFTSSKFTASENSEDQDTVIANNMGVIHLRVRHYAIAAKFFQHGISFDIKTCNLYNDAPLHCLNASMMPEILYNLGISMLHLQRPKDAFDCFLVPLKVYHNNPRLWLRVAESCIMFYEKTIMESDKKHVISSVIGSGVTRRFILEPSPKIKSPVNGQLSAIPNPNLEFASLCLRNAVMLIESVKHRFSSEGTESHEKNWSKVEDTNLCIPSIPITKESFDNLLAAIYASYSYVSIRLGDFVIALEYAKQLLELKNLSDAYTMLGHLYCAESLVMLNRLPEARAHLEPKIVTNSNYFDFETRNWQLNSLESAQAVIKYNLVVTLLLQGEFDVARALLSTFTHPVVMNKVKLLKMYIELATGKLN